MDDLERKVSELEEWRRSVETSVTRLQDDQEYRDRYMHERDQRWSRIALWIGAVAACTTVGFGLAAIASQLFRLF